MKNSQDKRSKRFEDNNERHVYKGRKSQQNRKMTRSIDNALKRKDFKYLTSSNIDIDNY